MKRDGPGLHAEMSPFRDDTFYVPEPLKLVAALIADAAKGGKRMDIAGQKFGMLVALSYVGKRQTGSKESLWLCRCDCGVEKAVSIGNLRSGNTKSCGCFQKAARITHGATRSKLYNVWASVINRCTNPNFNDYRNYGGRGIQMCERWRTSFANFAADMGGCPKGMSIDRIDNNGHYEPGNCRWATRKEQARNMRKNRLLTLNGVTRCVAEWVEITGLPHKVITYRHKKGWSDEKTLTTGMGEA